MFYFHRRQSERFEQNSVTFNLYNGPLGDSCVFILSFIPELQRWTFKQPTFSLIRSVLWTMEQTQTACVNREATTRGVQGKDDQRSKMFQAIRK